MSKLCPFVTSVGHTGPQHKGDNSPVKRSTTIGPLTTAAAAQAVVGIVERVVKRIDRNGRSCNLLFIAPTGNV